MDFALSLSSKMKLIKWSATLCLVVSTFSFNVQVFITVFLTITILCALYFLDCDSEKICELNGGRRCIDPEDDPDKDCIPTPEVCII